MSDALPPVPETFSSILEEASVDRSKLHANLLASDAATSSLSLGKYTADLGWASQPNPLIFWIDFLVTATAGYGLIYIVSLLPIFSLLQLAVAFPAAICMFRACLFMHEAVHSGKAIPGFTAVYNLYFGFVNKVPLYIYGPHRHHHAHEYYGTLQDPEYELLKRDVPNLIMPLVVMVLAPVLMVVRFGVLPWFLPFIGERGRNAVYQYASTFALNRHYKRPLPDAAERREWYWQDAGCALYQAVFVALSATDVLSWDLAWAWYGVAVITLLEQF